MHSVIQKLKTAPLIVQYNGHGKIDFLIKRDTLIRYKYVTDTNGKKLRETYETIPLWLNDKRLDGIEDEYNDALSDLSNPTTVITNAYEAFLSFKKKEVFAKDNTETQLYIAEQKAKMEELVSCYSNLPIYASCGQEKMHSKDWYVSVKIDLRYSEKNIRFYIPLDTTISLSSITGFSILRNNGFDFDNPKEAVYNAAKYNYSAVYENFRSFNMIMTPLITNAIVDGILEGTRKRFNSIEILLMGGMCRFLKYPPKELIKWACHNNNYFMVLYISSLTDKIYTVNNLYKRKSMFNIFSLLHDLMKEYQKKEERESYMKNRLTNLTEINLGKQTDNSSSDSSSDSDSSSSDSDSSSDSSSSDSTTYSDRIFDQIIDTRKNSEGQEMNFEKVRDFCFRAMHYILENKYLILHYHAAETMEKCKKFLTIDVISPEKTKYLSLFSKMGKFNNRMFMDETSGVEQGELLPVSYVNKEDSLVLMLTRVVKPIVEKRRGSLYILYNPEGKVIMEETELSTISHDDFNEITSNRKFSDIVNDSTSSNILRNFYSNIVSRYILEPSKTSLTKEVLFQTAKNLNKKTIKALKEKNPQIIDYNFAGNVLDWLTVPGLKNHTEYLFSLKESEKFLNHLKRLFPLQQHAKYLEFTNKAFDLDELRTIFPIAELENYPVLLQINNLRNKDASYMSLQHLINKKILDIFDLYQNELDKQRKLMVDMIMAPGETYNEHKSITFLLRHATIYETYFIDITTELEKYKLNQQYEHYINNDMQLEVKDMIEEHPDIALYKPKQPRELKKYFKKGLTVKSDKLSDIYLEIMLHDKITATAIRCGFSNFYDLDKYITNIRMYVNLESLMDTYKSLLKPDATNQVPFDAMTIAQNVNAFEKFFVEHKKDSKNIFHGTERIKFNESNARWVINNETNIRHIINDRELIKQIVANTTKYEQILPLVPFVKNKHMVQLIILLEIYDKLFKNSRVSAAYKDLLKTLIDQHEINESKFISWTKTHSGVNLGNMTSNVPIEFLNLLKTKTLNMSAFEWALITLSSLPDRSTHYTNMISIYLDEVLYAQNLIYSLEKFAINAQEIISISSRPVEIFSHIDTPIPFTEEEVHEGGHQLEKTFKYMAFDFAAEVKNVYANFVSDFEENMGHAYTKISKTNNNISDINQSILPHAPPMDKFIFGGNYDIYMSFSAEVRNYRNKVIDTFHNFVKKDFPDYLYEFNLFIERYRDTPIDEFNKLANAHVVPLLPLSILNKVKQWFNFNLRFNIKNATEQFSGVSLFGKLTETLMSIPGKLDNKIQVLYASDPRIILNEDNVEEVFLHGRNNIKYFSIGKQKYNNLPTLVFVLNEQKNPKETSGRNFSNTGYLEAVIKNLHVKNYNEKHNENKDPEDKENESIDINMTRNVILSTYGKRKKTIENSSNKTTNTDSEKWIVLPAVEYNSNIANPNEIIPHLDDIPSEFYDEFLGDGYPNNIVYYSAKEKKILPSYDEKFIKEWEIQVMAYLYENLTGVDYLGTEYLSIYSKLMSIINHLVFIRESLSPLIIKRKEDQDISKEKNTKDSKNEKMSKREERYGKKNSSTKTLKNLETKFEINPEDAKKLKMHQTMLENLFRKILSDKKISFIIHSR